MKKPRSFKKRVAAAVRNPRSIFTPGQIERARASVLRDGAAPSLYWNERTLSLLTPREWMILVAAVGLGELAERIDDQKFTQTVLRVMNVRRTTRLKQLIS